MPVYRVHSESTIDSMTDALRRRLRNALILLLSTILVSTVGFFFLERSPEIAYSDRILTAFWDTLNLVSTVGSLQGDYGPIERIWAIGVIVFGLGAVLYGFGTIQALIHGDTIRDLYREGKMKKDFASLEDHVVLCGYGQVGREAARNLSRSGAEFLIIDQDPSRADGADADGYAVVVGDATDEHTLRRVGLERARGVIATLDTDEANVYLTLVSREINPNLRIVTRAERAERRTTMQRAGADRVIVPGETAGVQLTQLMLKPNVSAFIDAAIGDGDYDLAELLVRGIPEIEGKTVGQLDERFSSKVIVVAVTRADNEPEFRPAADRVLTNEDAIIVLTQAGALTDFADLPVDSDT